jgi:hypothetical protein
MPPQKIVLNNGLPQGKADRKPVDAAFEAQLEADLIQSEAAVRSIDVQGGIIDSANTLLNARRTVLEFQPAPQFIWRVVNYCLGRGGRINKLDDGLLFGLKTLLLNLSADPILGKGGTPKNIREVTESVPSDVIAAVSAIHAVCRKLKSRDFHAVWGPILDDALIRALLGFYVGQMSESFGPGRGMLAGFSGRSGLAVLVATGTTKQAQDAIALLSSGRSIQDVARDLYGTDPLEVSAMILSACGLGKDAVLGVAGYAAGVSARVASLAIEQRRWLAALTVTDVARMGNLSDVPEDFWTLLEYDSRAERQELEQIVLTLKRRGHGLSWLV